MRVGPSLCVADVGGGSLIWRSAEPVQIRYRVGGTKGESGTISVLQTSHLDCALAGRLHVIRGQ